MKSGRFNEKETKRQRHEERKKTMKKRQIDKEAKTQ